MDKVDFRDYKIEKKKTLNYKVYEILKEMIINGDLKPDTKLNEVQIGRELGVSATPVREAFRLLSAEGLVEVIPYKGVYVKEYTLNDIREVYQCRESLEVMAIELAIDNIDENEIDEIERTLEKSNTDPTSIVRTNNYLHNFILEKANNKRLKSLLESLKDVLLHDRNVSAYDSKRRLEIYNEHMDILEALRMKDTAKAASYMRKHIRNGYHYIEKKVNR